MYVVTSIPFVSRTRATLRSAEFGFLGVVVYTRVQTPRFCGAPRRAGVFVLVFGATRPLRTSWLTVGTEPPATFLHTTTVGGDHALPTGLTMGANVAQRRQTNGCGLRPHAERVSGR